ASGIGQGRFIFPGWRLSNPLLAGEGGRRPGEGRAGPGRLALIRRFAAPSPSGSDFLGSVYLTLTEAVVDLKPVEPRDARVDVLGPQLGWQVLIVLSELISIRSVVVRHEDSVPVDPHVPLQSPKYAVAMCFASQLVAGGASR